MYETSPNPTYCAAVLRRVLVGIVYLWSASQVLFSWPAAVSEKGRQGFTAVSHRTATVSLSFVQVASAVAYKLSYPCEDYIVEIPNLPDAVTRGGTFTASF